jgi:sigma-B regulation protein RsbU (phosphoserine phosphatase)
MMLKIKTLQQRFVVYMLLPVALLLGGMGTIGFIYARQTLLRQWEESAILRLQRAAHQVDMRLAGPKLSVGIYLSLVRNHRHPERMLRQMLPELERREGVLAVNIIATGGETAEGSEDRLRNPAGRDAGPMVHGMVPMHRQMMSGQRFHISLPRFDPDSSSRTVSILTQADTPESTTGFQVEVVMDFDYLLGGIGDDGWWQRRKAFLVDTSGNVLVGPAADKRERLGRNGNRLEQATLEAITANPSGTVRGPGRPPDEVSGFHRLVEAPWYMVVFAPGEEILRPIIRFRTYYFLILGVFILAILFLVRLVTGGVARSVDQLSVAAGDIARGRFDIVLPERNGDEIGALTHDFNTMAAQLKERVQLRQSLDLAKEVQQNLLPAKAPDFPGLDVAGRSVYCDQTGGDYFDYLDTGQSFQFVVGDVAGHGISAALLMSSVRASLRQCYDSGDDIGAVISDVNRHIAMDVGDSGQFMTLFYLAIDSDRKTMQWVRAGHDPGMLYRHSADRFEELGGTGIALGVDPEWSFSIQTADNLQGGDIVLLGTDGIWEAFNGDGVMFGKAAVKQMLRKNRDQPADVILNSVFEAVASHAGETKIADDMTLIVVKIAA